MFLGTINLRSAKQGHCLNIIFSWYEKNIAPTNINLLLFLKFVAYAHVSLFNNYSQKEKLILLNSSRGLFNNINWAWGE